MHAASKMSPYFAILLAKDFQLGSVYTTSTLQIKERRESLVYGVKRPIGRMVNHKPA